MNWKWLLLLVLSYFIYLLIGAAIFGAIERPNEEESCQKAKEELEAAVNEAKLKNSMTFTDLKNFSGLLKNAEGNGVIVNEALTNFTCTVNWDFQSAFFFSGTVVTTIGYGNISPSTRGGRIFCIFYALIGIPLFALMFSGLGEKIAGGVNKLDERVKGKTKRSWVRKLVVMLIFSTSLCILCLLIPAAIFMSVEQWSYNDAFYYSFITLTTIGFGDFVVGTNPDIEYISIYRVIVYFWILFGMAYMATAVSLISGFFKKTGERANARGRGTEEVDGEGEEGGPERVDGDGGSISRHYEEVDAESGNDEKEQLPNSVAEIKEDKDNDQYENVEANETNDNS